MEEKKIIAASVQYQDERAQANTRPTLYLQGIVISGVMESSYLLSLLKDNGVDESYFSDSECLVIYKAIQNYYEKTQSVPPTEEVLMKEVMNYQLQLNFIGTDEQQVKKRIRELKEQGKKLKNQESYMIMCAEELITKVRCQRAAEKALAKLRESSSNGELDSQGFIQDVAEAVSVSLSPTAIHIMGDLSKLHKIRKEAYGDGYYGAVIPSCIKSINEAFQYQGYQMGTLNMVVAPPGVGKTSFLINEAVNAAKLGKTVLHVYLGDMILQDSIIRYLACINGTAQKELALMSEMEQKDTIERTNELNGNILDRIGSLCYAAGEISVDKLLEVIKKDQVKGEKHYDLINIDYADNFEKKGENMYLEAGYIYERLAWFARLNRSVIMVASQPKQQYWSEEIIPMEGAGESSKKAHTADSCICINRAGKGKDFGTIFMAKVRRGTTGAIIRYQSRWDICRIDELDEEDYQAMRSGQ